MEALGTPFLPNAKKIVENAQALAKGLINRGFVLQGGGTDKRWQEYTGELYKKDLHDPDDHDGVITHLEPDILECEVKWALESITKNKATGGDGIPVDYFKS